MQIYTRFRKVMFTTLLTVGVVGLNVLVVGQAADEEADADQDSTHASVRPVEIVTTENETTITMQPKPNDVVVVTYDRGDGRPAQPYGGVIFPAQTDRLVLRIDIEAPDPEEGRSWLIKHGVAVVDSMSSLVGGQILPRPSSAKPLAIGRIIVPVNIEGVEVHLFPFIIEKGQVGSVMVVIGKDIDSIAKAVEIEDVTLFDWKTRVEKVSDFLPSLKK